MVHPALDVAERMRFLEARSRGQGGEAASRDVYEARKMLQPWQGTWVEDDSHSKEEHSSREDPIRPLSRQVSDASEPRGRDPASTDVA